MCTLPLWPPCIYSIVVCVEKQYHTCSCCVYFWLCCVFTAKLSFSSHWQWNSSQRPSFSPTTHSSLLKSSSQNFFLGSYYTYYTYCFVAFTLQACIFCSQIGLFLQAAKHAGLDGHYQYVGQATQQLEVSAVIAKCPLMVDSPKQVVVCTLNSTVYGC